MTKEQAILVAKDHMSSNARAVHIPFEATRVDQDSIQPDIIGKLYFRSKHGNSPDKYKRINPYWCVPFTVSNSKTKVIKVIVKVYDDGRIVGPEKF